MLTLHRGSNTIVTDESFSVKLKWVNPACYMDSIPGDVGLGIEISVNEYTRTEFGNPERFEKLSSGSDRKFSDVSVRFSGALLMTGTLVITNATRETYSGWLQSEVGVLGTKQRDRFITEMNWKKDVTFVNAPGIEYDCIPLINPAFWDGKGYELPEGATYRDSNGNVKINNEAKTALSIEFREFKGYVVNRLLSTSPMVVDTSGPACVVSPFLFLNYAVTELFRLNGFFVEQDGNPLADPFFQLLIYNNYNIFKQEFTLEERTVSTFNQETNEDENVQIIQVMNTAWSLGIFNYADLLPRIALKDFIVNLQNWLNVVFLFKNDKTVQIISRNSIPDADAYSLDDYFLGYWSMGERKDVTLKFISELDQSDALISEEWHDLSDRRADFAATVETFEELRLLPSPVFGELRLVRSENKIYEYKWTVFTAEDNQRWANQTDVCDWTFASIQPQPLFFGESNEVEEITTGCSTLQDYGYGVSSIKHTRQSGNISSARSLWSDFSLRLLATGVAALNHALDFQGEYGLFEQRWKKWARFWKNRLPVEGEFSMPLNELHYVINHITQPYSTRHGKFIIEEMECDFQGQQMSNVRIKGYKL